MRLENAGEKWYEGSGKLGPFPTYYAAACFSMFALLRNYRLQMNILSGERGLKKWRKLGRGSEVPGTCRLLTSVSGSRHSAAIFN